MKQAPPGHPAKKLTRRSKPRFPALELTVGSTYTISGRLAHGRSGNIETSATRCAEPSCQRHVGESDVQKCWKFRPSTPVLRKEPPDCILHTPMSPPRWGKNLAVYWAGSIRKIRRSEGRGGASCSSFKIRCPMRSGTPRCSHEGRSTLTAGCRRCFADIDVRYLFYKCSRNGNDP
ncbi:hypothetical protein FA13DRAFT_1208053 [Coprinellus micaceus]|uniref:Uncharacterized protein n=1 Tax=Coprinellus micaceus TaxID=71717 RepID=A0A4Y7TP68_COPMI|nr:hypothetical protein FA13DRAFT_1208053 [Coprinellus micaceus]